MPIMAFGSITDLYLLDARRTFPERNWQSKMFQILLHVFWRAKWLPFENHSSVEGYDFFF